MSSPQPAFSTFQMARAVVVLLLLFALAVLFTREPDRRPPERAAAQQRTVQAAGPAWTPATPRATAPAATPTGSASASSAPASSAPASSAPASAAQAPQTPESRSVVQVRGRLSLPDGRPARGVELLLQGWVGGHERVLEHGLPEDWNNLTATSDGEGRFELRFDPPPAYEFMLDAHPAGGYAGASWRWSAIAPGRDLDLGDIALAPAGALIVRMVDAQGQPLQDDWRVYAEAGEESTDGRDATRVHEAYDPKLGTARLDDVPAGEVRLRAYSRLAGWAEGPTVQSAAGGLTEATIHYAGPSNAERIVVVAFTRPFGAVRPEAGAFVLRGADLELRSTPVDDLPRYHSFEGLPPGQYRIELDDPRYAPWSQEGIEPGQRLDARLSGSASLALEVYDARRDMPLAHYRALLQIADEEGQPRLYSLRDVGEPEPAGGLYAELPAVEVSLRVEVQAYAPFELPAPVSLRPGETTRVQVRLDPAD